jgi:hypothetical protein
MKNNLLFLIILILSNWSYSQQIIDLPIGEFDWHHDLIPFNDGSYAITVNNKKENNTYFYSATGALKFSKSYKGDVVYSNKNQSLVNPETKESYTISTTRSKITVAVMNSKMEIEKFDIPKENLTFSFSEYEVNKYSREKFIAPDGKIYWLFWLNILDAGDSRTVSVVCFDPSTKKLEAKQNSFLTNEAIYFEFIGFNDGTPTFGGMKQTGIVKEIALSLYTLEGIDLKKYNTIPISLEDNIKPLYICGINNDQKKSSTLTFAIGVAQMNGPLIELSHGYKFIQMSSKNQLKIVSWYPEGLKTKGKIPMISYVGDTIEKIIIKGDSKGIMLDVNYDNETISEPFRFNCENNLEETNFWNYLLNPSNYSEEASEAFLKLINPNNSEILSIYENPHIFQNKEGHWVIVRCYGSSGRKLEILKN